MKKPSKQWKEFEQIIGIVDIRIKRKQREIVKMKKQAAEVEEEAASFFQQISEARESLRNLRPTAEANAIDVYFRRSDYCKSMIENYLIDYSLLQEKIKKIQQAIEVLNKERFKLEKRKDALREVQGVL